jgi:DNA transposition AAA+ family ATPase
MQTQDDFQREILRLQEQTEAMAIEQVVLTHQWLDNQRLCRQPGRILGESRTGKTFAVRSYQKHNSVQSNPGLSPVFSVVAFQVPQECGAKELYTLILEALKFKSIKGTTADLRRRVNKKLEDCKVEMLIIDEADRIKPKFFADVRDLSDNPDISVILVGTDRLEPVISRDEQIKNRFYAYFRMGKLNSLQFAKTVAIWETQVLKLPVASNLTAKATLKLLREKTQGYIGILDMILRQAAIAALKKGEPKITIETLKEVMAGHG